MLYHTSLKQHIEFLFSRFITFVAVIKKTKCAKGGYCRIVKKWDIIDSPHGSLCHKADIGIIDDVTHSHLPIGLYNGVK